MKKKIDSTFSASILGFWSGCVCTVRACSQLCVNISRAPAVLMAALWIALTVMVKCSQDGDVHQWVYTVQQKQQVCFCVFWDMFKVFSPLPTCGHWCDLTDPARFCFHHPQCGFGGAEFATLALSPEPCFLSVPVLQPLLTVLILTRAVWCLTLINGYLLVSQRVKCCQSRTACVVVTKRLWVRSKQEFFFSFSPMKMN